MQGCPLSNFGIYQTEGVLASVLAASAVPYGYTLATWGAGAVLVPIPRRSDDRQVFILAAGAIVAGFT